MKKIFIRKALIVINIAFFIIASVFPIINSKIITTTRDSCDIPTWSVGDEWIYKADPVSFQSDNGSFVGKIENLKRKVIGITTVTHGDEQFEVYEIDSTGDISGTITWGIFSGPLVGQIEGVSYIRVSDLAEVKTEIDSTGIVTILFINRNYELINVNSFFPPLELYDFPLKLNDQWSLSSNVITTGSFTIQDLVEEDISGSDMIDEVVQCNTKEMVNVPAGDFDCYEVTYSSDSYWYSPEVGNLVKSVVGQIGRDDTLEMDLALVNFTRVGQPINIVENIDPSEAFIYQEINISGYAIDSNGEPIQNNNIYIEIPRIEESWSTTTDENGFYSYVIEGPLMVDDTQSEGEFGSDGVIVRCTFDNSYGYIVKTLLIIDNLPPNTPTIEGENEGKVGVEYEYTFSSFDEDGNDIIFYVNWGDGSPIETVTPTNPSETEATANHKWDKKGVYNVTAQSKDAIGAYSKWSDPLSVSIPRTRSIDNPILRLVKDHSLLYKILQIFFK